MTIKQKFNSIDQSKLTADQKSFLDKIKNVTKDFTDAEMNKKVETPLDNFIAKAKEKMPEAVKSAPVKRTAKAKAKRTTPAKPKRTAMSLAKEIRKEGESWKDAQVRARAMMKEDSKDLSKVVESELDKLSKLVKSEKHRSKLAGISGTDIKRDAVRRAKPRGVRKVTHSGETSNQYGTYKNHLGRKYSESRDRHSDRLAPNYPKGAPKLANGGMMNNMSVHDGTDFMNTPVYHQGGALPFAEGGDIDAFTLRMVKSNGIQPAEVLKEDANVKYNRGGSVTNERKHVNHSEDYEVRYAKPRPSRKGYKDTRKFAVGGGIFSDAFTGTTGTHYTGLVGETNAMSSGEMFMAGGSIDKNFDLSGYRKFRTFNDLEEAKEYVDMDRKKYPRVKESVVIKEGNRYQVWMVPATGIETGNRVYADGGAVMQNQQLIADAHLRPAEMFGREGIPAYKDGGGIPNNYEGKTPEQIWGMLTTSQRYHFLHDHNKEIESTPRSIEDNTKKSYKFLPTKVKTSFTKHIQTGEYANGGDFMNNVYAKGGGVRQVGNREYSYGRNWTNDHNHVNKSENHEVKYNRKGKFLGIFNKGGGVYKVKRSFSRGGLLGQSAKVKFLSEEFASLDLIDELKSKLKTEKNNVEDKDVIAFAYTDYGGDILDKYAIEYFLENHPNNIVVEQTSYNGKNAFVFGKPAKEWMKETEDYPLGFEDFESYFYEKENEDFEEGVNYFIKDLGRDYSFNEDEVRDALLEQFSGYFSVGTSGLDYSEDVMIKYLKENDLIKKEYNRGGAVTNERKHVNHSEDYEVRYAKPRPSRKGYKGARKFMAGGMNDESPRIYVADLEAYNNGRLVGEWLDLSDYNDADELMDAIQNLLDGWGVEEYAIHDAEYIPSNLYSEYMSRNDFQVLYEVMETAKRNDLPLEVVQDIVSQYGEGGVEEFQGKYDNAEDFAERLVDDIGIESFNDYQYYLDVSETDRRLLSQEMADSYVDDIRHEDGGNRLIEEAGMDVEEYEEADSDTQEEMLDKAREIVYDEYYGTWYEGLSDPYYFLVEEQGMYDAESFANANFVRVDYEKLGDALEQDYTFIEHDGYLYVFNIR